MNERSAVRGGALFLAIVGVGGVAALVALGVWQTQRLAWKTDLIATMTERLSAAPIETTGEETAERHNFTHATAEGRFLEADPIRFLASKKPHGPGHRYIHPFVLGNGATILVDRGFAPSGVAPQTPPTGEQRLSGVLHWPNEISAFTPEPNRAERRWFARDVLTMAEIYDAAPVMLTLDATPSDTGRWPEPIPVTVDLPNDHLGYAITWFSLAGVWLAMSLYVATRRRPPGAPASKEEG